VPARMIFLFPLFLMLLISGAAVHRRLGPVVVGAMLALSVCGIWSYFHKTGFRNKQYPIPMVEIAGSMERQSNPGNSVVLVDSANSDPLALRYALGPFRVVMETGDLGTPEQLARLLAAPELTTVWFLRSTRDLSPDGRSDRIEASLRRGMRFVAAASFEPFTPLETALMRAIGIADPPHYFQELLEFRSPLQP